GERQPADDWAGAGGRGIGPGPGAGGDESEGATGERAVAEGPGDRGAGGSEFGDRAHQSGDGGAEHGSIDAGAGGERGGAIERRGSAVGIYQDLCAGKAIVTVVDFSDTWVLAAIPETESDHIGFGDTLRVRLPGGTVVPGKVF